MTVAFKIKTLEEYITNHEVVPRKKVYLKKSLGLPIKMSQTLSLNFFSKSKNKDAISVTRLFKLNLLMNFLRKKSIIQVLHKNRQQN